MSGFDFYKKLKWLFDHLINIKSRKQVHLDFKKLKRTPSLVTHTSIILEGDEQLERKTQNSNNLLCSFPSISGQTNFIIRSNTSSPCGLSSSSMSHFFKQSRITFPFKLREKGFIKLKKGLSLIDTLIYKLHQVFRIT